MRSSLLRWFRIYATRMDGLRLMGNMLPSASFSTRDVPPSSRYESWRTLLAAVFEPSLPAGSCREDIRVEARAIHLGHMLVADVAAEAQHFTRTRRLISSEDTDHYMIQAYRSGACEGIYGETLTTVVPGDIKIFDLAHTFRSLNTDFDNTTLTIPRALMAPLLAEPDGLHGLVLTRNSPFARVLNAHISTLSAVAATLDPMEGATMATATVRLIASCLGANPRWRDETMPYRAAAIGQVVRDYIDRHLASETLDPEMLAARFRMSRAQLYRLFAETGGVAAYIQARRLQHCFTALNDLTQNKRGIGEIAFGFGFKSEAHFSRVFRRAFGISPSEARAGAAVASPAGKDTFISDWIRDLSRLAG